MGLSLLRRVVSMLQSKCEVCRDGINFDEDGGHIYPDGTVICCGCEQ